MAEWPATLPDFVLQQGFQEGFKDSTVRSTMDTGPKKQRRRTTTAVKPVSYTVVLTDDEVDIFEDWWDNDVKSGSISFTKENPRTEVVDTYRFTKAPDPITPEGWNTYILVLPLEIMP